MQNAGAFYYGREAWMNGYLPRKLVNFEMILKNRLIILLFKHILFPKRNKLSLKKEECLTERIEWS